MIPLAYDYIKSTGTLCNFNNYKDILQSFLLDKWSHNITSEPECWIIGDSKYYECFDPFWSRYSYSGSKLFYYSYPALPVWYEKVINEFNEIIEHSKIEILVEKDIYGDLIRPSKWGRTNSSDYVKIIPGNSGEFKFKSAIFTNNISDKFSSNAKRNIEYQIHHYLRMISYTEINYINLDDKEPDSYYVEAPLIYNNRSLPLHNYRALKDTPLDLSELKLLDQVDVINRLFKSGYIKQSGFFDKILWEFVEDKTQSRGFCVGDRINAKGWGNRTFIIKEFTNAGAVKLYNPISGSLEIRISTISKCEE